MKYSDDFINKIFHGDCLDLMEKIPSNSIDLIYIDPPYNLGKDIKNKEDQILYSDKWVFDKKREKEYNQISGNLKILLSTFKTLDIKSKYFPYLVMVSIRLIEMKRILKDTGSIYVHIDWHASHYVKIILDVIFGRDNFQREIIWRMGWVSGYKTQAKNWIRNHDTILYYVKDSSNFTFNKMWIPYPPDYERWGGREKGKGLAIEDIWGVHVGEHINSLAVVSYKHENLGFPTQKSEALLERIIKASSNEGDLVADFFCGSGTTLIVAEKLNRRWVGSDISERAIQITNDRIEEYRKETKNRFF